MARLSAPRCGGLLSRIADINVTIDDGPCFSIRAWLESKATRSAPFTQSLPGAPRSEGKSAGSSVTLVILALAAASHPALAPDFPSSSRTTQEKSHGTFGDKGRHPTSVSRGASVQEIPRREGSVGFGLHRDRRRHRDLRSHRVGPDGPGDVRHQGCVSLILP